MKKNIVFLFSLLSLASCSYQSNNRIEQDDVNEGNEYVYGVHPDSVARQLNVTYTAKPELEARTAAIREKLYGPSTPAATTEAAPAAADSTKVGA
jgi:hypothetical protein